MAAQPLDVIARFRGVAVFIELLSTNFTAATVVSHPADAQWAQWGRGVAGALSRALPLCLRNSVRGKVRLWQTVGLKTLKNKVFIETGCDIFPNRNEGR